MTEQEKYIKDIKSTLSQRTLLEGLAEESAELTQASLKLIRALGTENTTPKSIDGCVSDLMEEVGDILMLLKVLDIDLPNVENNPKWERWHNRIVT